jgi:hypothetical protein
MGLCLSGRSNHFWLSLIPRIPISVSSFGCIIVLFSTIVLLFVLLWIWYYFDHYLYFCSLTFGHYCVCPSITSFNVFGIFRLFVYDVTWSSNGHGVNCIYCWQWWSSLNYIFFFSREIEYHIQSNTNSKTIVLNNTIIHRSTLTCIGMRGIRDNQKILQRRPKIKQHKHHYIDFGRHQSGKQKMKMDKGQIIHNPNEKGQ